MTFKLKKPKFFIIEGCTTKVNDMMCSGVVCMLSIRVKLVTHPMRKGLFSPVTGRAAGRFTHRLFALFAACV